MWDILTEKLKYWLTEMQVLSTDHKSLDVGSRGLIERLEKITESLWFPVPSVLVVRDDCYLQILHMHFIQKGGRKKPGKAFSIMTPSSSISIYLSVNDQQAQLKKKSTWTFQDTILMPSISLFNVWAIKFYLLFTLFIYL